MISSKELKYVELWANKIPMPGVEYSMHILNEIKKCYELFKEKYQDKEYSIIFSNNEEIDFNILSSNLCHMLGIDYKNIMGEYFDYYRYNAFGLESNDMTSFQLVEEIINNMEKVAMLDNDPNNKAKAINYYKSAIKCAIINRFADFQKFDFAAINYNGDRKDIDYSIQKLLFIPSCEAVAPYFFMGIKKSIENDKYFVYSILAPEDSKHFFENQEVIIPTQILISDNDNLQKISATPEEKLKLITLYSNIVNKYNINNNLNITGDYETMLNDLNSEKLILKK